METKGGLESGFWNDGFNFNSVGLKLINAHVTDLKGLVAHGNLAVEGRRIGVAGAVVLVLVVVIAGRVGRIVVVIPGKEGGRLENTQPEAEGKGDCFRKWGAERGGGC